MMMPLLRHSMRTIGLPAFRRLLVALTLVALGNVSYAAMSIRTIAVDGSSVREPTFHVTVTRGGEKINARPGFELQPGDELTTADDAQVVIVSADDAIEIYVQPDSTLRISSIFLRIGELYVRVKRELRDKFEVQSEYGVAGVEGTEFVVRVDRANRDARNYSCTTLAGRVNVSDPAGRWQASQVPAGSQIVVYANEQPEVWAVPRAELDSIASRYNRIRSLHLEEAAPVTVPDLIGLTVENARDYLQASLLQVGDVRIVLAEGASGAVQSQVPRPGDRVSPNSRVALVVELQPTRVPDLRGKTLQDIRTELAQAQLQLGQVRPAPGESNAHWTVSFQSLEPDAEVPVDSKIDVNIAEPASDLRPAAPSPPIIGTAPLGPVP